MASPSPTRRARKRARTRAELIAATRSVVRRDGVARLTVDAVAELADVSKASVYYYFASKEDLIRTLALSLVADERAAVRRAVTAAPPGPAVLDALVRSHVAFHRGELELFRAAYLWVQVVGVGDVDVDAEVNDEMVALFDLVEARLTDPGAPARLRPGVDARRLAFSTWMAAHGITATLAVLDNGGTRLLHEADALVDELCRSLVAGAFSPVG